MAYNKFTIETVRKTFGIEVVSDQKIFSEIVSVVPSDLLQKFLDRYVSLGSAIGTEKARSEFIIAPILAELTELTHHQVSLFSGIDFNVDDERGLTGRCDFMLSASNSQYSLVAPVLAVVEAKNENLNTGLGQCMAEMIAVQIFNAKEGLPPQTVYGAVTTGSVWKFLKLDEARICIDTKEYFIESLELILGILLAIVKK